MDIFHRGFFAIGLASLLAIVACSSDSSSSAENKNPPIHNKTISGLAEKGPFLEGSTVTLYELDDITKEKTGKSFSGNVSGGRGEFTVPDVELTSPYALIEVKGKFMSETGDSDTATLYALTSLDGRETVNVNLLTHLEYRRVLQLLKEGLFFSDAKHKALNEIFSAFGFETTDKNSEDLSIFGKSEEDAELLFFTARFQSFSLVMSGSLEALVDSFVFDLEKDGIWDNDTLKFALAEAEFPIGMIREEMESWNISDTIPDFGKYHRAFWRSVHGFPKCEAQNAGTFVRDSFDICPYHGRSYVCENGEWKIVPYDVTDTNPLECSEEGAIVSGNLVATNHYVCDSDSFRLATPMEMKLGKGCTSYTEGDTLRSAYEYVCKWDSSYGSGKHSWLYPIENTVKGTLVDSRDGKVYKTVAIGEQVWMAENLNFAGADSSFCYNDSSENCEKYGRLYVWYEAVNQGSADYEQFFEDIYNEKTDARIQGICPDGWHLPRLEEWLLLNRYSLELGNDNYPLYADGYWYWGRHGSDPLGFTALPAGKRDEKNGEYSDIGVAAYFWTPDKGAYLNVYSVVKMKGMFYMNPKYYHINDEPYSSALSVRCVKN